MKTLTDFIVNLGILVLYNHTSETKRIRHIFNQRKALFLARVKLWQFDQIRKGKPSPAIRIERMLIDCELLKAEIAMKKAKQNLQTGLRVI